MKANEIRIGNFVQDEEGVFPITPTYFTLLELNLKTTQPIQLTEEWLLKFGFEKITHLTDGYNKGVPIQKYIYNKFYILNIDLLNPNFGIGLHDVWDGLSIEVKHVHQLQNLYFALTGEELTVK